MSTKPPAWRCCTSRTSGWSPASTTRTRSSSTATWDVGSGGYRVGAFPPLWTEWNDRYRNAVRDFWRGALPDVRDLGYRLSGSSDLYAWGGRRPYASVNFVTAHDGFTLADLTAYDDKHNLENGEANRDGSSSNLSFNHGIEGPTHDHHIVMARRKAMRNLLGTLLLSAGVSMLTGPDTRTGPFGITCTRVRRVTFCPPG